MRYVQHEPMLFAWSNCCRWVTGPYSDCSRTCEGVQTREVTCECKDENNLNVVSSQAFCDRDDPRIRPLASRACGVECPPPSTYSWVSSDWSSCDKVCGPGKQTRTVDCVRQLEMSVSEGTSDSDCEGAGIGPKPVTERDCDVTCRYEIGDWGACSVSCDGGQQTRSVTCLRTETDSSTTTVQLSDCEEDVSLGSKPSDTQPCNVQPCVVAPVVGTCRHFISRIC
jgi:hypothetical protein